MFHNGLVYVLKGLDYAQKASAATTSLEKTASGHFSVIVHTLTHGFYTIIYSDEGMEESCIFVPVTRIFGALINKPNEL